MFYFIPSADIFDGGGKVLETSVKFALLRFPALPQVVSFTERESQMYALCYNGMGRMGMVMIGKLS